MSIDRREDAGDFYPGGKVISTRPVATGGDVKHSEFEDLDVRTNTIPDLREAVRELGRRLGATVVTALAACVAIAATVQTVPVNYLDFDANPSIVTNVVFDAPPDFSTSNTTLVATIHQTEVDPTVPAWAKKTVGDFYSDNLYSLVNRDFYANDSSIKSQYSIWLKGSPNPTVTVGRDKLSDNTFPYARQTVLGFSAYEGFDYYAHYRPRGIYIWPWWNEDAEDDIAYLFPTNGNGGTFALTSDFSTNNAALVETIDSVSPPPANYANVSNAAMNAASRVSPTITNMIKIVGYGNANWELFGGQSGWYFKDSNGNNYRIDLNSDSFATSNDVGSASNVLLASRKWVDDRYVKQDALTFDDEPTKGSNNPVKSGGIWSALWGELDSIPYSLTSMYDWAKCSFASPFAIAPKFELGDTYAVGDVRIEVDVVGGSGLLYRCKKGYRPDGESNYPSGDSEHWEEISVNTLLAGKATTDDIDAISDSIPPAVSNIVTTALVRERLGVYLYVGEDGGIYVHTNED